MKINEEVKEAARRLSIARIKQGFKPEGLHEYQDEKGNTLYYRLRLKNMKTGEKIIWPMSKDQLGRFVLKEPRFSSGKKPIYRQYEIANNENETVFVVEGEKCVDSLIKIGVIATTSGGDTSARSADWSLLKGRDVVMWPDNDDGGVKYSEDVVFELSSLGCRINIVDIDKLKLSKKGDCVNWLEMNPCATKDDVFSLPLVTTQVVDRENAVCGITSERPPDLLLDLLKDVEFFHDEQKKLYALFRHNGHDETRMLEDANFKDWLAMIYRKKYGKVISDYYLKEVLQELKGRALFDGECCKVFLRIGNFEDKVYIDLANADWQVVEVSSDGWRLLNKSPVKFKRVGSMKSLPFPEVSDISIVARLDLLWACLTVPENQRILIIAYLLECLRVNTNYPILVFTGMQGSAKSWTMKVLRRLFDPSVVDVRTPPKRFDDIMISAENNYCVCYDNMSHLNQNEQNDICCISTGGGFARRTLYITDAETVSDIKRPGLFGGIANFVTAQDLIDRSIVIELPVIDERSRKTEAELESLFYQSYHAIFSSLLDLMALVLKEIPNVKLEKTLRMSDFCYLGVALERVLITEKVSWVRQGNFMSAYRSNRNKAMAEALESSPVVVALIQYMMRRRIYKGTYARLLKDITIEYQPSSKIGWPSSPRGLSAALKIHEPALKVACIKVVRDPVRHNDGNYVEIEYDKSLFSDDENDAHNIHDVQEESSAIMASDEGGGRSEYVFHESGKSDIECQAIMEDAKKIASYFPGEHKITTIKDR